MPHTALQPTRASAGQAVPKDIGLQLVQVDMAAHSRGENLATLVEARHQAITQRKA